MPVVIPNDLPAAKILRDKGIFVISDKRATKQDIRALKICILNLMPDKITTENQLLAQLSNSIIQIDITLLAIKNHEHKNTSLDHLESFYKYFDDIKNEKFDAIIITGAPIEHMEFEDVSYWHELVEILEWTKTNVFTSLYICWASQAALKYFYNIDKEAFKKKLYGVYKHTKLYKKDKLFMGVNDHFLACHSRNTQSVQDDIIKHKDLHVLATSKEAGISIIANHTRSQLFITAHFEYDRDTLKNEYLRDKEKDSLFDIPENYFVDDNPNKRIKANWFSDASLIYLNWLNHYVYQKTRYVL